MLLALAPGTRSDGRCQIEVVAKGASSRKARSGPMAPCSSSSMAATRSCASARTVRLTKLWERPGCGPAALVQVGPGPPGHLLRREHAGAGVTLGRDAAGLRQGRGRRRVHRTQRFRRRRQGRRVHVGLGPVGDRTDRRQDPLSRPERHACARSPTTSTTPTAWPSRRTAGRSTARRPTATGSWRSMSARMAASPTAASSPASPPSRAAPSRWRQTD